MYEKSLTLLNRAVADELSAFNQCLYFAIRCEHKNRDSLSRLFREIAEDERLHVEYVAGRVLALKGRLNFAASAKVKRFYDVDDMLQFARIMEERNALNYSRWTNECAANGDAASVRVFENLASEAKRHSCRYDEVL
jgi:bacterioferritin